MNSADILIAFLAKKHFITGDREKAKKEIMTGTISLKKPTDLFIRDSLFGLGTILLEDLEKHYYITTVKYGLFGSAVSYAIIQREDDKAEISVYAHEGLIKQNIALKTIEKLKTVLT